MRAQVLFGPGLRLMGPRVLLDVLFLHEILEGHHKHFALLPQQATEQVITNRPPACDTVISIFQDEGGIWNIEVDSVNWLGERVFKVEGHWEALTAEEVTALPKDVTFVADEETFRRAIRGYAAELKAKWQKIPPHVLMDLDRLPPRNDEFGWWLIRSHWEETKRVRRMLEGK